MAAVLVTDAEQALGLTEVGPRESPREGGFALHVSDVMPVLAAEEALTDVLDLALDVGFPLRVSRHRRIDHEPAVRAVFLEGPLEDGFVTVGLGHCGAQIVEDDTRGYASEVLPRVLEAVDEIGNLLCRRDVDVLMTAVDERDDQRMDDAAPPRRLRIRHQAEPPEVDLGELARLDIGDPHRDAPPLMETAVLDRKTVKRAIRDANGSGLRLSRKVGHPRKNFPRPLGHARENFTPKVGHAHEK